MLRVLDGSRKATVLQFLYEAKLIGYSVDELVDNVPRSTATVVSLSGKFDRS